MKLAMISQWYDPEGSSDALTGVIVRALSARGTAIMSSRSDRTTWKRIFPTSRVRPHRREQLHRVIVYRAPLYPSHDGRAGRRVATYKFLAALAVPAIAPDIVRATPIVLHVQYLWPQTMTHTGFLAEGHSSRDERALPRYCDLLALGDVQLISLKDGPVLRGTMPSNVQANMAAGPPIVAAAGDAASVTNSSGAGFVSAPEDSIGTESIQPMARLSAQEREATRVRAHSLRGDLQMSRWSATALEDSRPQRVGARRPL